MTRTIFPIDPISHALAVPRRIGAWTLRQLLEHSFTFDQLDGSAAALWPVNPEEPEPPRWRLDLIQPRDRRAVPGRQDGERTVRRNPLRTARTSSEACR
jgi:hypothetical protein